MSFSLRIISPTLAALIYCVGLLEGDRETMLKKEQIKKRDREIKSCTTYELTYLEKKN
jgi:hypothetical protein